MGRKSRRKRWSFREYLDSPQWQAKKDWYRRTARICECFSCGHQRVQFHHLTYKRFGRERLRDLLPLCGGCHKELHAFLKAREWPVSRSKEALAILFDFTAEELREREIEFQPLPKAKKPKARPSREPGPLTERQRWRAEKSLKRPRF